MKVSRWIVAVVFTSVLAVAGLTACSESDSASEGTAPAPSDMTDETTSDIQDEVDMSSNAAWLDTELTDAVTGEVFKISDFAGEPVLIQAFAVW